MFVIKGVPDMAHSQHIVNKISVLRGIVENRDQSVHAS